MMVTQDSRLNAWETQCAIAFVCRKARTQGEAEKGAVAAAIAVTIATRGPVAAVDFFRDLADLIERDAVLPPGEVLQ